MNKLKNNINSKCIGVWMDHSNANMIHINDEKNVHNIISKFNFNVKVEALSRSENIMHNKEQQLQEAYYKEIADKILIFNHVLLFGPTNAKTELNNYLKKDLHFKNIKIDLEPADKMTDNEKYAFVLNHFNKLK